RTENNRVVNFPGERARVGSYADVRISAVLSHSLRGELVTEEQACP
ncbi:MAG TPA: TRAM domain-containing protein, partial [Burkholderiales bacterium]